MAKDAHIIAADREWDRRCEAEDMQNERINEVVKERIHDDHYGFELVAETVPQNDIQWKYFREMLIRQLEGKEVNYDQIGRMFVAEAIDYVVEGVKEDL